MLIRAFPAKLTQLLFCRPAPVWRAQPRLLAAVATPSRRRHRPKMGSVAVRRLPPSIPSSVRRPLPRRPSGRAGPALLHTIHMHKLPPYIIQRLIGCPPTLHLPPKAARARSPPTRLYRHLRCTSRSRSDSSGCPRRNTRATRTGSRALVELDLSQDRRLARAAAAAPPHHKASTPAPQQPRSSLLAPACARRMPARRACRA